MAPRSDARTSTPAWICDNDPLHVTRRVSTLHVGFDPRCDYVETYWLPVLGPSCILVARRLADWLDGADVALQVPLELLARTVGLGTGTGRSAPVVRTLSRLVDFGIAAIEHETYALRIPFPPLSFRQVARLPDYLATRHAIDVVRHAGSEVSGPVEVSSR